MALLTFENVLNRVGRQEHLPASLENAFKTFLDVAKNRGIYSGNIYELFSKLNLEFKSSYLKEHNLTEEFILKFRTFLESKGLTLIPISVPYNLDVSSNIYITKKTDYALDPDIILVRNLSNNRPSKYTYRQLETINLVKTKIANYNLLVAAFEHLGALQREPIDSHQRSVLSEIISSKELPRDGDRFIRTLYSYVCDHGSYNYHFRKEEYVSRPLPPEAFSEMLNIIAKVISASHVAVTVPKDYPWRNELLEIYNKITPEPYSVAASAIVQAKALPIMARPLSKMTSGVKLRRLKADLYFELNAIVNNHLYSAERYKEIADIITNNFGDELATAVRATRKTNDAKILPYFRKDRLVYLTAREEYDKNNSTEEAKIKQDIGLDFGEYGEEAEEAENTSSKVVSAFELPQNSSKMSSRGKGAANAAALAAGAAVSVVSAGSASASAAGAGAAAKGGLEFGEGASEGDSGIGDDAGVGGKEARQAALVSSRIQARTDLFSPENYEKASDSIKANADGEFELGYNKQALAAGAALDAGDGLADVNLVNTGKSNDKYALCNDDFETILAKRHGLSSSFMSKVRELRVAAPENTASHCDDLEKTLESNETLLFYLPCIEETKLVLHLNRSNREPIYGYILKNPSAATDAYSVTYMSLRDKEMDYGDKLKKARAKFKKCKTIMANALSSYSKAEVENAVKVLEEISAKFSEDELNTDIPVSCLKHNDWESFSTLDNVKYVNNAISFYKSRGSKLPSGVQCEYCESMENAGKAFVGKHNTVQDIVDGNSETSFSFLKDETQPTPFHVATFTWDRINHLMHSYMIYAKDREHLTPNPDSDYCPGLETFVQTPLKQPERLSKTVCYEFFMRTLFSNPDVDTMATLDSLFEIITSDISNLRHVDVKPLIYYHSMYYFDRYLLNPSGHFNNEAMYMAFFFAEPAAIHIYLKRIVQRFGNRLINIPREFFTLIAINSILQSDVAESADDISSIAANLSVSNDFLLTTSIRARANLIYDAVHNTKEGSLLYLLNLNKNVVQSNFSNHDSVRLIDPNDIQKFVIEILVEEALNQLRRVGIENGASAKVLEAIFIARLKLRRKYYACKLRTIYHHHRGDDAESNIDFGQNSPHLMRSTNKVKFDNYLDPFIASLFDCKAFDDAYSGEFDNNIYSDPFIKYIPSLSDFYEDPEQDDEVAAKIKRLTDVPRDSVETKLTTSYIQSMEDATRRANALTSAVLDDALSGVADFDTDEGTPTVVAGKRSSARNSLRDLHNIASKSKQPKEAIKRSKDVQTAFFDERGKKIHILNGDGSFNLKNPIFGSISSSNINTVFHAIEHAERTIGNNSHWSTGLANFINFRLDDMVDWCKEKEKTSTKYISGHDGYYDDSEPHIYKLIIAPIYNELITNFASTVYSINASLEVIEAKQNRGHLCNALYGHNLNFISHYRFLVDMLATPADTTEFVNLRRFASKVASLQELGINTKLNTEQYDAFSKLSRTSLGMMTLPITGSFVETLGLEQNSPFSMVEIPESMLSKLQSANFEMILDKLSYIEVVIWIITTLTEGSEDVVLKVDPSLLPFAEEREEPVFSYQSINLNAPVNDSGHLSEANAHNSGVLVKHVLMEKLAKLVLAQNVAGIDAKDVSTLVANAINRMFINASQYRLSLHTLRMLERHVRMSCDNNIVSLHFKQIFCHAFVALGYIYEDQSNSFEAAYAYFANMCRGTTRAFSLEMDHQYLGTNLAFPSRFSDLKAQVVFVQNHEKLEQNLYDRKKLILDRNKISAKLYESNEVKKAITELREKEEAALYQSFNKDPDKTTAKNKASAATAATATTVANETKATAKASAANAAAAASAKAAKDAAEANIKSTAAKAAAIANAQALGTIYDESMIDSANNAVDISEGLSVSLVNSKNSNGNSSASTISLSDRSLSTKAYDSEATVELSQAQKDSIAASADNAVRATDASISNGSNKGSSPFNPKLKALLDSLQAQGTDVMVYNEFNGLCLSHGLISGDYSIEALNDYAFDTYDEPVLEKEGQGPDAVVYITLDLLEQMAKL